MEISWPSGFYEMIPMQQLQIAFGLGLLLFATYGCVKTYIGLIDMLRSPTTIRATERNFLFSSVPYVLYGIFIIYYFLRQ